MNIINYFRNTERVNEEYYHIETDNILFLNMNLDVDTIISMLTKKECDTLTLHDLMSLRSQLIAETNGWA